MARVKCGTTCGANAFVAELAIDALDVSVLGRPTGLDELQIDAVAVSPLIELTQAGFQGTLGVLAGFGAISALPPLVAPNAAVAAAGMTGMASLGHHAMTSTSVE